MIDPTALARADQSCPPATRRLRIVRLAHRFGLPVPRAELVADIVWSGADE